MALVITIIILLILAGITIGMLVGENGIIKRAFEAKENTIRASEEERKALNSLWAELENNGGSGEEGEATGKMSDFKKAIAEYIEQAGGVKPENPETASTEKFGESILGLSTKDATAIAEDILTGKTAYVKGEKITGTRQTLEVQTEGTATAADIIEGKTAWVNGNKITGIYHSVSNTPVAGKYEKEIEGGFNTLYTDSYGGLSLIGVNKIKITITGTFRDIPSLGSSAYEAYLTYKYRLYKNDGTVTEQLEVNASGNRSKPGIIEIDVSGYDSMSFTWHASGGGMNGGMAYMTIEAVD